MNNFTKNNENKIHFTSISLHSRNWLNIEFIIFSGSYIALFAFGLFSNIVVIIVYIVNKQFKKNSYFFINLCVSDLLVLICCVPVAIIDLFSPDIWLFGSIFCNKYFFIYDSNIFSQPF